MKSPAGAHQWAPKDGVASDQIPDAHDPATRHAPMMTTADMAMKVDPAYNAISKRFHENPDEFADAFARAWFKLMHRDMGPVERYLGPEVPSEELLWQDPVPAIDHALVNDADLAQLKQQIAETGLSVSELVRTAWASAASYRDSDKRGGANGARVAMAPAKDWAVNTPDELSRVLDQLKSVQAAFNDAQSGDKRVSLADLIVLGGGVGIEQAAKAAGHDAVAVYVRHDVAIPRQKRLGRTHLGADGQLAFCDPVAPILGEFGGRMRFLGATGAEGALVHLAAAAKVAGLRELRRAKGARIKAITTPDAEVLGVEHHPFLVLVKAVCRADRHTGRIGTVHAGHRDRPFTGVTIIDGDHAAAVDAPGHFMLVLTRRDTGVAFNAALGVAQELGSRLSS